MWVLAVLTLLVLIAFMILCVFLASQFGKNLQRLNSDVRQIFRDADQQLTGRLESATRAVADVHEHLGKLEESQRRVYEVGKNIAGLQELLRAPKMRGGIGELFLEELLNQIMPKDFFVLQYEFKNNQRIDAVIKFGQGLVPVDAKFPLENFRRLIELGDETQKRAARRQFISDVKAHIRSISDKYIMPDEGTFDFALMYIPAENVYYETIIKDEKFDEGSGLFQYSLTKKVVPVSPNSFYAYLRVILLGLKGMAVEKGAQEIIRGLSRLRNDFDRFYTDFSRIGKHLSHSRSTYEEAEKRLTRLGDKLTRIEAPPSHQIPQKVIE